MRRSKFKPFLEMMETRLTLSNMTAPVAPPAPGDFATPLPPITLPPEPADTSTPFGHFAFDSPDRMDFSAQAVPTIIPLYCDQYTYGSDIPLDPAYTD